MAISDTQADDTYGALSGVLPCTGQAASFRLAGGIVSGNQITRAGNYGTLVLNRTTGAYTYTPNESVLEVQKLAVSDVFTVQAMIQLLAAKQFGRIKKFLVRVFRSSTLVGIPTLVTFKIV